MVLTPEKLQSKDLVRRRIPRGFKSLAINAMCSKPISALLALIYKDLIPHRNGLRIDTKSRRVSGSTKAAIYFGIYERAEIDQMEAFCDFSLPVVELGASIGVCSVQIIRNDAKKCIAIEADPEIFEILKTNIKLNFGEQHSCIPINCAIDYSGRKFISFEPGLNSLSGQIENSENLSRSRLSRSRYRVPTAILSDILTANNIEKYNLVIDIEGSEAGLIIADQKALQKCYRIMAEIDGGFHQGRSYTIQDLIDRLKSQGFRVLHSHGNRFTLENTRISSNLF